MSSAALKVKWYSFVPLVLTLMSTEDSDSDDQQANVSVAFDDSEEEAGRGAPCYSDGDSDGSGDSDADVSSQAPQTPVQNAALQMLASVSRSLPPSGDSEAREEEHAGTDTEWENSISLEECNKRGWFQHQRSRSHGLFAQYTRRLSVKHPMAKMQTHCCIALNKDGSRCYKFFNLLPKKVKGREERMPLNAATVFESSKCTVHLEHEHGIRSKRKRGCDTMQLEATAEGHDDTIYDVV